MALPFRYHVDRGELLHSDAASRIPDLRNQPGIETRQDQDPLLRTYEGRLSWRTDVADRLGRNPVLLHGQDQVTLNHVLDQREFLRRLTPFFDREFRAVRLLDTGTQHGIV